METVGSDGFKHPEQNSDSQAQPFDDEAARKLLDFMTHCRPDEMTPEELDELLDTSLGISREGDSSEG